MKLLFDFDGVLTDQTAEAGWYKKSFHDKLYEFGGVSKEKTAALLEHAYQNMRANPHEHGWKQHHRLTAYANEDLLVENVGLSICLDEYAATENGVAAEILENLKKNDYPSFFEVSQSAYAFMVEQTRNGNEKNPLDEQVLVLFEDLLNDGHHITIVSNSSTKRIIDIFAEAGLDVPDHEKEPNAPFKIRGGACKFDLDEHKQGFWVHDYWLDTARPNYLKIIREEKPSIITGDVFTLDLATPIFLTRSEPDVFGGMKVVLRQQGYTPQWTQDFFNQNEETNAKLCVIHKLDEFMNLLQE
jgi:FMN phosphatase YigB (HAD superfamily)